MNTRGLSFPLCIALGCGVGVGACMPPAATPGMVDQPTQPHAGDASLVELARAQPPSGERALLVVFPKTACSGSARMVVLDEEGTFYGAVAPGEAALLDVPTARRELLVVSNVEIEAAPRTWRLVERVEVPAEPGGLLLSSMRANTRTCGSGQYVNVSTATKPQLEEVLGAMDARWRAPRRELGQAWIDAHRERVSELVGKPQLARWR